VKNIFLKFSIFLLAIYINPVFASTLDEQIAKYQIDTPRIKQIIALTTNDINQPTKQIHDEFWGLLLTRFNKTDVYELSNQLKNSYVEPLQYQLELWTCIKESSANHKVVITQKLTEFRKKVPQSNITKDYEEKQNQMLISAANGTLYKLRNGDEVKLNAAYASNNIAKIKTAKNRLEKLLNANWE